MSRIETPFIGGTIFPAAPAEPALALDEKLAASILGPRLFALFADGRRPRPEAAGLEAPLVDAVLDEPANDRERATAGERQIGGVVTDVVSVTVDRDARDFGMRGQ